MFWPFRRSQGWRIVKGREGFVVEMPAPTKRTREKVETAEGPLQMTNYLAIASEGFTCHVTVREGPAVESLSDVEVVEQWKSEFARAMAANALDTKLADEGPLPGGTPGRELTYQSPGGALTRVRLVRDRTRLIALVAIGPPDRVQTDGERFLTSFILDPVD